MSGLAARAVRASGRAARRSSALGAAVLLGLPGAGCGSGDRSAAATDAPPTAATAIAALGSVPDSAAARRSIEISDLTAIKRAAGSPSRHQTQTQVALLALQQGQVGSPAVGTELLNDGSVLAPFGYPVLGLRVQLEVGFVPDDEGEAWGPIRSASVAAALAPAKPHSATVGTTRVFDFGTKPHELLPQPFDLALIGLRYIAVPAGGGRVLDAGNQASRASMLQLANGRLAAHPVRTDPLVAPLLRAFGSHVQSLTLGTGYIGPGAKRPPAGPLMVGLAYIGGTPEHQSVMAAALYPSAADARAAVAIVGHYTATGYDYRFDLPYRRIWRVTSDIANGPLVTLRLRTSNSAPSNAMNDGSFPLFWR
jgi:hypothetical protein